MPNSDYNQIADPYVKFMKHPVKHYAERFTLIKTVGSVKGLNIADLACGNGVCARMWAAMGAKSVTGVDISSEMVDRAREIEGERALGVSYVVADGANPMDMAKLRESHFDVITAVHLLTYAEDIDQLRAMIQGLRAALESGKRFVHVSCSHTHAVDGLHRHTEGYGVKTNIMHNTNENIRVAYTMDIDGKPLEIQNTLWPHDTLKEEFEKQGFKDVTIEVGEVNPEGYGVLGGAYWRSYEAAPLYCILSATRV